jgi:hypothetical protein
MMKRKLVYFIALLVILAGTIVPALYMQKVFSSNQRYQQAESSDLNVEEQSSTVSQNRPAHSQGQPSPELEQGQTAAEKSQPTTEAKQGSSKPSQQASAVNNFSGESTVPAQATDNETKEAEPESGCKVGVAIVGKNDEILFRPAQVKVKKDNKWGLTALGALDATGISYTTMPTWPDFVDSIRGQANSGMTGWMYSVNSEVPMHMADKHPVKTGDKVIWWYSRSMDQPHPQWEDLVQEN